MPERVVIPDVRFERYEDFRRWTEDQPGYWILVRGVPMPSPSPSLSHQHVSKKLAFLLFQIVEQKGQGFVFYAPLDVKIRENTVYQPDLLVILANVREHADRIQETHIEGAPDLIIEILSPSTAQMDPLDKRYDYAEAGVAEYWIVDPVGHRVEVYGLQERRFVLIETAQEKGRIRSRLIPDFEVDLADLFASIS